MSEIIAEQVSPEGPEVVEGAKPEPVEDLGEGGKKAIAAEREARKEADRKLAEALDKIKSFEDRDKSELEKALERAEAAEDAVKAREDADAATAAKAAKDAELAELVAEVAKAKALDDTAVAALRGSTREELEAHADILKPLFTAPEVIPDPGKTPDNKPSEEAAFVRGLFGGE